MRYGMNMMANSITCVRIICSVVLFFCQPFEIPFYVFYVVAGISDMTDGFVARKTHSESEFGARLDTIADFIFIVVCLIKLIPVLELDRYVYIWIMIIAAIKVINLVSGFAINKKMVAIHSVLNKITGAILFVLPLLLRWIELRYLALGVCAVATIAAIQEGFIIIAYRKTIT